MRVVTICNLPPPFGGAEVFAKELALRLGEEGEEICIVTQKLFEIQLIDNVEILQYPYLPEQQWDVAGKGIKIYPLFVGLFKRKFIGKDIENIHERLVQEMEEVFFREKADLVHCHFTTAIMEKALSICRKMKIPLVVTLHGMTNLVPMYDSYVRRRLTSAYILSLLRLCTQVVVVNRQMLDYCWGKGLHNVSMIPTGIDTKYFSPVDHIEKDGIFYVGKLDKYKGLKETLRAYLKIENVIKEDLYLVGRGIDTGMFDKTGFFLNSHEKERVGELIREGRIHLLGELFPYNLREFYRKRKLLVLPSLTEGFPLVILEALSCGMPVIASDVGATSEVIQNGRNGYLIPKADSDELAKAIIRMFKNYHSGLDELCRNSVNGYEIKRIARDYISLFQDVLVVSIILCEILFF